MALDSRDSGKELSFWTKADSLEWLIRPTSVRENKALTHQSDLTSSSIPSMPRLQNCNAYIGNTCAFSLPIKWLN